MTTSPATSPRARLCVLAAAVLVTSACHRSDSNFSVNGGETGGVTPPDQSEFGLDIGPNFAWATFQTDIPATGCVEWGLTPEYGEEACEPFARFEHRVLISGLMPNETYHYRIVSTGPGGVSVSEDMTFTTLGEQSILSDTFNFQNLDRWLWAIEDPPGAGQLRMEGAPTDGGVRLTTAAGLDYRVDAVGRALQLLQASNPGNFTSEMKLTTALDAEGESSGVIYLFNAENFIRFGFDYIDGNVELRATLTKIGQTAEHTSTIINFGPWDGMSPLFLRTRHDSNTWTADWSLDGLTFMPGVTLVAPLPVNHSGPYVASNPGSTEPHSALIDFFFDDAFRIEPEDETVRTDRTEPFIYRVEPTVLSSSSVGVTWFTDELAQGVLEFGETEDLELPPVTANEAGFSQSIEIDQLFANTQYFLRVMAEDLVGNEASSATLQVQTGN